MATMQVEVVSAEKSLLSVEATELYARSMDGEIGILPGHQPCLLALDIAPIKVKLADGSTERIAVHHGFLYFQQNQAVILADTAELASQIDRRRAEARLKQAEGEAESVESAKAVRRQQVRLDVAEG
ncbi:MAG: ATP synthase F1 subunit epsilon [Nitriliruptorales bacterium]|nr:ATP synthase F1 subunit epsilon [Nitriliruptorales bacterium]